MNEWMYESSWSACVPSALGILKGTEAGLGWWSLSE